MFKAAKEAGAEAIDPSEAGAGPSGGVRAFHGGGFKLGSDTAESVQVGGGQEKRPDPRHFTLKMWRDGFSLDDGELRAYTDPAHRLDSGVGSFVYYWFGLQGVSCQCYEGDYSSRAGEGSQGWRGSRGHGGPQRGGVCQALCEVQALPR